MPAELPAVRSGKKVFVRTPAPLRGYSLTAKSRRVHSPQHGEKRATKGTDCIAGINATTIARQRLAETGDASNERSGRSANVAQCDERIAPTADS